MGGASVQTIVPTAEGSPPGPLLVARPAHDVPFPILWHAHWLGSPVAPGGTEYTSASTQPGSKSDMDLARATWILQDPDQSARGGPLGGGWSPAPLEV